MRFKIHIEIKNYRNSLLPGDHQYPLSAVVYKFIQLGDLHYSQWLHDNGYKDGAKSFKFFCFSNIRLSSFHLIKNPEWPLFRIQEPHAHFIFSTLPGPTVQNFIQGIFKDQRFTLAVHGQKLEMRISSIEALPEPTFSGCMDFVPLSPLLLTYTDRSINDHPQYAKPTDSFYAVLLEKNLREKLKVLQNYGLASNLGETEGPVSIEPLVSPQKIQGRPVMILKKDMPPEKIIGQFFPFRLTAPLGLMKLGYYGGTGSLTSEGFGCYELKYSQQ
jgi:CRISPR-associated endoribonuclease Cas6